MAGTDLYWARGEQALLELAETLRIPVFLNGLARGCVPADHELFFSRARSQALKGRTWRWWLVCRWTSGWPLAALLARTRRSW